MAEMTYRRLGRSGLKVSLLSFGSWVTFGPQLDTGLAADCIGAALDAGVNFLDNAEAYAGGESERIMGDALRKLDVDRRDVIVSSKYYWGVRDNPHTKFTLNRKYLVEAVDASLERFGFDHLDLIYCHRADPDTPIEETVWAMSDIISSGKAHYWGTSEWTADELRAAYGIAERHHLHAPVTEQPQYNLLWRKRVEKEYARLYEDHGLGLTTWSPLASGLLTGKYVDGIPDGSRASLTGYEWLAENLTDEQRNHQVGEMVTLAGELDCTPAQLALAWCARNPNVSSVITGASRVEQVTENMAALDVLDALTDEVTGRLEAIFGRVG